MPIAYLTDVEGRWDKVVRFCDDNPAVTLSGDRLDVVPGAILVFGGEASCELLQLRRVIKQLLNRNRSVRIRHSRRQPDGNRLERTKFQLAPPVAELFLDRVRAVLADGIEQALSMPLHERQARHRSMMSVLNENDITAWRTRFVADLSGPDHHLGNNDTQVLSA